MGPNNQNQQYQPPTPAQSSPGQSGPQPNVPFQPYFLQPDASAPVPADYGQKPKRKWGFIIAAGVVLLLLASVAVVVSIKTAKKPITTAPKAVVLTTQTIDALRFVYPDSWQQVDARPLGFTLAYGSNATYTESTASIYYKKTAIMPATPPAKVTADTQQAIEDAVVTGVQTTNTSSTSSCSGFKLGAQTKLATSTYFGLDVSYTCTSNAQGVATQEHDRFLYTGDGNLYQVAVVANSTYWQQNGSLLTTMIQRIVPS